jgi:hypothetical protein
MTEVALKENGVVYFEYYKKSTSKALEVSPSRTTSQNRDGDQTP